MKSTTATKPTPVIQNVSAIVSSMKPQFEAIGVARQGLRKWNSSEPTTTRTIRKATNMRAPTPPLGS